MSLGIKELELHELHGFLAWLKDSAAIMQFFSTNPLIFATPKGNYLIIDNGAVAQLVEQRTENPCVGGSIPPHTTERP